MNLGERKGKGKKRVGEKKGKGKGKGEEGRGGKGDFLFNRQRYFLRQFYFLLHDMNKNSKIKIMKKTIMSYGKI